VMFVRRPMPSTIYKTFKILAPGSLLKRQVVYGGCSVTVVRQRRQALGAAHRPDATNSALSSEK
jgi:hypothetical protein